MRSRNAGKGPLSGWRGSLKETTDTFDIKEFLKSDGPINAEGVADLRRAIVEGGTFGDYRRVESSKSGGWNFFVSGPNSILFFKKEDSQKLLEAIEEIRIAEVQERRADAAKVE